MGLYPKITSDFFTDPRFGAVQPEAGAMPPAPPMPTEPAAPSLYNSPYPYPSSTSEPQAPTEAPKQDRPGFLRRIRSQPGGDRALLEFGAAMLSSNTFSEGLGKGALAYRTALDNETEKNKPQFTKDFTHTIEKDPVTGQPTFKRTAVADFEEKQLGTKLETQRIMAKLRDDGSTARTEATIAANKDHWASQDKLARDHMDAEGNWREDDREARERVARITATSKLEVSDRNASNKLPPAQIQMQIGDHQKSASQAEGAVKNGTEVLAALRGGSLKLGVLNNLMYTGSLKTGVGITDAARQYGGMQQFIASLANTILMDAKGVQTDGDAVRARLQILVAEGDNEAVAEEMERALAGVERGRRYNAARASDLSTQYGARTTAVEEAKPKPNGRASALKAKYGLK